MTVRFVNSFFRLFRENPRDIEMAPIPNPIAGAPDDEPIQMILDLVGDPTHTALVSQQFRRCSSHSYKLLVIAYSTHPSLAALVTSEGAPVEKVKGLYLRVIQEAKSCGIEIEPDPLPLAPQRLARIRKLTLQRFDDKFSFYRAVFPAINAQFAQTFDQMTREEVFEFAEENLGSRKELFSSRPTNLNLWTKQLTYLPPQIRYLTALRELSLHHNNLTKLPPEMRALTKLTTLALNRNPLSPENVKAVCKTLPKLRTVIVDNEQRGLIEMFQTHFPHLQLTVVQILRLEEI